MQAGGAWVRHDSPHIELYTHEDFMTAAECEELARGAARFRRSTTVGGGGTDAYRGQTHKSRTSTTSHFSPAQAARFEDLARARLPEAVARDASEPPQLQRYRAGQFFKEHYDTFDEHLLQPAGAKPRHEQRTWTLMVYLDGLPATRLQARGTRRRPRGGADDADGSTHFTHPDVDARFAPRRGRALLWNNLDAHGRRDVRTIHRGARVPPGRAKTICTMWFHGRPPA